MKTCISCSTPKPLAGFHRRADAPDGRKNQCKACLNPVENARTKAIPSEKRRAMHLRTKYGITQERFDKMLERQGGACAICQKPETHLRRGKIAPLCVDHCHTTGRVRGLLCCKCNRALGQLGDDVETITRALRYLAPDWTGSV